MVKDPVGGQMFPPRQWSKTLSAGVAKGYAGGAWSPEARGRLYGLTISDFSPNRRGHNENATEMRDHSLSRSCGNRPGTRSIGKPYTNTLFVDKVLLLPGYSFLMTILSCTYSVDIPYLSRK